MSLEDDRHHLARLINRLRFLKERGIPERLLANLLEDIDDLKTRISEQEQT